MLRKGVIADTARKKHRRSLERRFGIQLPDGPSIFAAEPGGIAFNTRLNTEYCAYVLPPSGFLRGEHSRWTTSAYFLRHPSPQV